MNRDPEAPPPRVCLPTAPRVYTRAEIRKDAREAQEARRWSRASQRMVAVEVACGAIGVLVFFLLVLLLVDLARP